MSTYYNTVIPLMMQARYIYLHEYIKMIAGVLIVADAHKYPFLES